MKVTILADHLLKAVKETERIAPKGSTIPILANLLIATKEGRLTVTASDLTQAVTVYVGAQVHEEGSCTIPATLLKRMLTKIKGERIELAGDKNGATMDIDGRTVKLDGHDPEDYPAVPDTFEHHGEVDGPLFAARLSRVSVCILGDGTRPALEGVHMVSDGDTLTLEATDGYKLARFTMPYTGDAIDCIVPGAAVTTLIRLIGEGPVAVNFSTGSSITQSNRIRFRLLHHDVVSTPINGTFPDVAQIIPDEWDRTVTVQPSDLLRELDAAITIANEASGIVRLITGEGILTLSAKAEAVGEYSADVDARIEGKPGRIAVGGNFLRTIVQMFDGPVGLRWTDTGSPIRLSENDDGLYVLMPMTAKWE